MNKDHETPERTRERLRQEELENNPFGHMNNGMGRAQYSLVDLVGSLGWKGTLVLIIVIIVGLIVAQYF
ncbi:hypothetical protein PVOR_19189 [Paenibacillus vortex V453]|jgi:hypothetical protein|uniref:Phage capsid protein n=1 Tax=Paenibacillus vortex V453 TaxID=715225 RepID=A0A2R9SSV0_9BACL|nr:MULTISPECIES: DUF6366 family protein [Paenibacillus]AWP27685.1 hypothetical protein B9D94_14110 [Paenibacillus sp. Cedars]EFU40438.1 hypothetical protein PVOR_19189 [Paenibacillus vortex V453]OMF66254.1 hypothetical protein BK142_29630 [Paenibacillus glucanolyticus]